jgi:hypothetical protein
MAEHEFLDIDEIIDAIKNAPRLGDSTDEPEGARYIKMSDTLAKLVVDSLENEKEERWHNGIDAMGEDA